MIVQWLPHEVSDVETVIDLLERQSANCVDVCTIEVDYLPVCWAEVFMSRDPSI